MRPVRLVAIAAVAALVLSGCTRETAGTVATTTGSAGTVVTSTTTGPAGSSASSTPAEPQVRTVLVTEDDVSSADLTASVTVLLRRLAEVRGAEVELDPPDRIVVTASGSDTSILDGIGRPGVLALRPVELAGRARENGKLTDTPDADPDSPNQPLSSTGPNWARWRAAQSAKLKAGRLDCGPVVTSAGDDDPRRPLVACDTDSATGYLLRPSLLSQDAVASAEAALTAQGSLTVWTVTVTFTAAAADTWTSFTAENIGLQVAFVVDGVVVSAPTVNQRIPGVTTQITGSFTRNSATALARSLDAGVLPVRFTQRPTEVVR